MFKVGGLLFIYFISAFWLNYNVIKNKTIKTPSYLTSLIFIILSLPLVHLQNPLGTALSTLFLTFIYVEVINSADSTNPKKRILNAGFLLGCLITLNHSFICFYLIILIALIYYQIFNWRHAAIQIIGILYPITICYIIFAPPLLETNKSIFVHEYSVFYKDLKCLLILLILLILSLKELYHNYYKKMEKSKKAFNLLFVILIMISLQAIVLHSVSFIHLLILPLTIIIANYLIYIKYKKFRTFLLGLLLITFMLKFLYP